MIPCASSSPCSFCLACLQTSTSTSVQTDRSLHLSVLQKCLSARESFDTWARTVPIGKNGLWRSLVDASQLKDGLLFGALDYLVLRDAQKDVAIGVRYAAMRSRTSLSGRGCKLIRSQREIGCIDPCVPKVHSPPRRVRPLSYQN